MASRMSASTSSGLSPLFSSRATKPQEPSPSYSRASRKHSALTEALGGSGERGVSLSSSPNLFSSAFLSSGEESYDANRTLSGGEEFEKNQMLGCLAGHYLGTGQTLFLGVPARPGHASGGTCNGLRHPCRLPCRARRMRTMCHSFRPSLMARITVLRSTSQFSARVSKSGQR